MIEQIPLLLATPIVKAILDKFYEGIGSKLGERAVELLPEKVKQVGQLVWEKYLCGKPEVSDLPQQAANGSLENQQRLTKYLHEALDQDLVFKQEVQKLAEEIYQVIHFDDVVAENVQQNFGGQNLQVNNPSQPVIQVQGNPAFHFGTFPNQD